MQKREDLDFTYFKKLLEEERKRLENELTQVRQEINTIAAQGDINDVEDMAQLNIENTRDQSLIKSLQSQLEETEAALHRIENGTYGICEKMGKLISKERLEANPAARFSIES